MFKFCPNCGTKVIPGSKFCYACGTSFEELRKKQEQFESDTEEIPIQEAEQEAEQEAIQMTPETIEDTEKEEEVTNEEVEEESSLPETVQNLPVQDEEDADDDEITFTVSGMDIVIDEELGCYATIRRQFSMLAIQEASEALEEYEQETHDFYGMIDGINRLYARHLSRALNMGRDLLLRVDIMDYDIDRLAEACGSDIDLTPYAEPLNNEIQKLYQLTEELTQQRAMERASRSEWVSTGGYNMSNAIGNSIKAGMLNLGASAIHGIGDSITDASDKRRIKKAAQAIYENQHYRMMIINGIHNCCFNVFKTVRRIMKLTYRENSKQAQAHFNNAQRLYTVNSMTESDYRHNIIEIIYEDPFNVKYYTELYKLNIFDYKTLENLTDFMGILHQFHNRVKDMAAAILKNLNPNQDDSIDDLKLKIKLLGELKEEDFADKDDLCMVEAQLTETLALALFRQLLPMETDSVEKFIDDQHKIRELKKQYPNVDFDVHMTNEDINLIARKYEEAAEEGNSTAQYVMAMKYSKFGSEAWFKWITASAEQGHDIAQDLLGIQYYTGEYTDKNNETAKMWLQKAAEQENAEAQYYLGRIALDEKDFEKVLNYFRKSSDNGYIQAKYDLADCYEKGIGVDVDIEMAKSLFQEASETYYPALYRYALLLDKESNNADSDDILNMYTTAFKNGIIDAGVSAGMYLEKRYKQKQDREAMKKAVHYYQAAVDQGNKKAAFHLGECYLDGNGVMQSERLAFQYLFMAVEELPEAMTEVGVCYFNGVGIKKDYNKAYKMFFKATKMRNTEALFNLAICCYYGLGTTEDKDRGLQLLKKAAGQGNTDAAELLAELGQEG